MSRWIVGIVVVALLVGAGTWLWLAVAGDGGTAREARIRPDLVLLTLDTTRADALGCYGARAEVTPNLDRLAGRGTRWSNTLTPAPLTLPAHASLLTGLEPPEHGVRDNGTAALPDDLPTLATVLAAEGYATGAVVASRVLDRRFGLGRGFDRYDDRIVAERVGEYGYPERDARAVTEAALSWVRAVERPYFLWAHYYDPHLPYVPPGVAPTAPPRARYAGEVAFMDREIGRLLDSLPGDPEARLVVAVGDHGEMLGEHDEDGHGIFLYSGALDVPLIVAGPGVPGDEVRSGVASIREVGATVFDLLGVEERDAAFGRSLLEEGESTSRPKTVYSETVLPATAYGWSPLSAISDRRWRLIVAPRPELYDLVNDPAEERNLVDRRRDEARRLERALDRRLEAMERRRAPSVEADPELRADLESLGYLSGATGSVVSGLDPKDGIRLLDDFERAKVLLERGRAEEARWILEPLVDENPTNVPFLTSLGRARFEVGRERAAVEAYRRAAELNPELDLVRLNLADALLESDDPEAARREFEAAIELNPRSARAWLRLAEIELAAGRTAAARELLRRGAEAGTHSASLFTRLAELDLRLGDLAAADEHLRRAVEVTPEWGPAWLAWGELARRQGDRELAAKRYAAAVRTMPGDPRPHLRLGELRLEDGDVETARELFLRAAELGGDTDVGAEARRLLDAL